MSVDFREPVEIRAPGGGEANAFNVKVGEVDCLTVDGPGSVTLASEDDQGVALLSTGSSGNVYLSLTQDALDPDPDQTSYVSLHPTGSILIKPYSAGAVEIGDYSNAEPPAGYAYNKAQFSSVSGFTPVSVEFTVDATGATATLLPEPFTQESGIFQLAIQFGGNGVITTGASNAAAIINVCRLYSGSGGFSSSEALVQLDPASGKPAVEWGAGSPVGVKYLPDAESAYDGTFTCRVTVLSYMPAFAAIPPP